MFARSIDAHALQRTNDLPQRPALAVPALQAAEAKTISNPSPPAHRRAHLPDMDGADRVPVYRRDTLLPGAQLRGPLLIEEEQSTLVVGAGPARVLEGGSILAELET